MTFDLKAWRAACGFTQAAAAKALGLSLPGYIKLENGQRNVSKRTEMACRWLATQPKP